MLIYQKHIFKQLTALFLLICFVCTSIIWLSQALKFVYLLAKGISLVNFLSLTLFTLPSLLLTIIPISFFLGTVFYLNKIKNDREMIVMENSGLSHLDITYPLIKLGFFLVLICYIISLLLLPYSYNKLKDKLDNLKEDFTITLLNAKTFNSVNKNITLYFDKKIAKDVLSNIIVFDYRNNNEQPAIIFAKFGKLIVQNKSISFYLTNGSRQFKDSNNIEVMQFNDLTINIEVSSKKKIRKDLESQERYLHELLYNNELNALRKNQLKAEGHQRIIWPLFNIVLAMIAAATIIPRDYQRKPSLRACIIACIIAITTIVLNFSLNSQAAKNSFIQYLVYLNPMIIVLISFKLLQSKNLILKAIRNYKYFRNSIFTRNKISKIF